MTTQADNSAGRLLAILQNAKAQSFRKELPASQGWARALGVEADSTDLFFALAELNRLYDSSILRVDRLGRNKPQYNAQLATIRKAISPALLNLQWGQIQAQLSDGGLMALSAYSEILSLLDPDGEVPAANLKELQEQVDDLIDAFIEAKTDTAFTQFALSQLQKVRDALIQYRFRGPEVLLQTLENVTGAMVGEQEVLEEARESQRAAYDAFGSVISHLHIAIQFAEKFSAYATALVEKVFLRLTDGSM